ncbi:FctA domain-containing protein, partial [Vibrio sp. FNV 38]|nr:FctA domain-containing protein [Vibrio sp. FNV 38]
IEAITEGAPLPTDEQGAEQTEVTVTAETADDLATQMEYAFETIKYKLSEHLKDVEEDDEGKRTKEFEYKVTESAYDMEGVEKDTTEYTVTVTVVDDRTGKLTVTATPDPEALDFTNEYWAEGNIRFAAFKTLQG